VEDRLRAYVTLVCAFKLVGRSEVKDRKWLSLLTMSIGSLHTERDWCLLPCGMT
jgi:hypothetical protein